jgi:hypothetical protein
MAVHPESLPTTVRGRPAWRDPEPVPPEVLSAIVDQLNALVQAVLHVAGPSGKSRCARKRGRRRATIPTDRPAAAGGRGFRAWLFRAPKRSNPGGPGPVRFVGDHHRRPRFSRSGGVSPVVHRGDPLRQAHSLGTYDTALDFFHVETGAAMRRFCIARGGTCDCGTPVHRA